MLATPITQDSKHELDLSPSLKPPTENNLIDASITNNTNNNNNGNQISTTVKIENDNALSEIRDDDEDDDEDDDDTTKRIEIGKSVTIFQKILGKKWDAYQIALSLFIVGRLSREELMEDISFVLENEETSKMHNQLLLSILANCYREEPFDGVTSSVFGNASKKRKSGTTSSQYEKLKKDILSLSIRERIRIKGITKDPTKRSVIQNSMAMSRQALVPKVPIVTNNHHQQQVNNNSNSTTSLNGSPKSNDANIQQQSVNKTNTLEMTMIAVKDILDMVNEPLCSETYELPERKRMRDIMLGLARERGLLGGVSMKAVDVLYLGLQYHLKSIISNIIDNMKVKESLDDDDDATNLEIETGMINVRDTNIEDKDDDADNDDDYDVDQNNEYHGDEVTNENEISNEDNEATENNENEDKDSEDKDSKNKNENENNEKDKEEENENEDEDDGATTITSSSTRKLNESEDTKDENLSEVNNDNEVTLETTNAEENVVLNRDKSEDTKLEKENNIQNTNEPIENDDTKKHTLDENKDSRTKRRKFTITTEDVFDSFSLTPYTIQPYGTLDLLIDNKLKNDDDYDIIAEEVMESKRQNNSMWAEIDRVITDTGFNGLNSYIIPNKLSDISHLLKPNERIGDPNAAGSGSESSNTNLALRDKDIGTPNELSWVINDLLAEDP